MKIAWLLVPLVFAGCSKTEPPTKSVEVSPAVQPAVQVKAPTEAQALTVASAWLGAVSEADQKPVDPALMSEHVSVEVALDDPQSTDCPRVATTIARTKAVECGAVEIGWISGVLGQHVATTTTTETTREVVAQLEAQHVRALDTALRVELTIELDATQTPVIRRVRFSNPG
jgi:hypothetical protein